MIEESEVYVGEADGEEEGAEMEESVWQGCGGGAGACAVVLRGVLAACGARELWRCGAVCRAWRAAALDRALWRRTLRPRLAPPVLRAFADAAAADGHHLDESPLARWSWRREYALSATRWRRARRLEAGGVGGAPLTHAALAPHHHRLALLAEDASVAIWEQCAESGEWHETWSYSLRARGWLRAEGAQWERSGARLLLAGPLALSDRWELAVLQSHEGSWRVACRAETGAGGAACWAGGEAFLSLRLRLLAPRLGVTTVWLNAVSQETTSEYSGVTTPLFRIFNEAAAHITHIVMTEMPSVPIDVDINEIGYDNTENADIEYGPRPEYYRAISETSPAYENADRVVVAAIGAAGSGVRGEARALGAWCVRAAELRPPPLLAGTGLAERVRRRRARAAQRDAAPHDEPPPPDEDAVRALCSPPDDLCPLGAQVLGLVVHPRGSCVWASTASGASCVSLPTLRLLLRVCTPPETAAAPPHLVSPDVDDDYLVTPAGGGSGRVQVWAARSGARGATLPHAAPALVALLPATASPAPGASPAPLASPAPRATHSPHSLLVLTPDALHIWENSLPFVD